MSATAESRPLTRRRFLTGAIVGGAGGVLATAGASVALTSPESTTAPTQTAAASTPMSTETPARSTSAGNATLTDNPTLADIGFCTDMTAHHVQALVMCERVLGFETGHAVQAAATEVLRNQAIEVGMMRAWLADWGASTAPPETVMAWMDMSNQMMGEMAEDPDTGMTMNFTAGIALAEMPGYASDAELLSLSQAEAGIPKGRIWLELMRAHHVGGVAMAEAAVELASAEKVVRLASTQAAVQSWEVDQYDLLLNTKYA